LFDAVACITGVARQNRFEGQAAMLLENEIGANQIVTEKIVGNEIDANRIEQGERYFLNKPFLTEEAYALPGGDWGSLIRSVVADQSAGLAVPLIAARFHNALVGWIVEVAAEAGLKQIVLSGGVFQNRYLTERASAVLEARGFAVHTHREVPPNDGGISLGQAVMCGV
jgi:hydrogenase maturation protein HypF